MTPVRLRNFEPGLIVAAVLSAFLLPTAGLAYSPEEQQACSPDAFRLCSSEIPDVDRVTACMVRKQSQLSPACRVYFRAGPEPAAAGAPTNIRPVAVRKSASVKPRKPKKPAKSAKPVKRDNT